MMKTAYLKENSLSLADLNVRDIAVSGLPSEKIMTSKGPVLQIVLNTPEMYIVLSSSQALPFASSK